MAKNNEAQAQRYARKAQGLLKRRGGKLRFIGGTALESTSIVGMEHMLKGLTSLKDREMLAEAISQCLQYVEHDWTVIYGFVHDHGNDEYTVDVDSLTVSSGNSDGMAMAANYTMAKEFSQQDPETRIGQVWMAIPKLLPDNYDEEDYINELLPWMAETCFFDSEHMRSRLAIIAATDIIEAEQAVNELEATG